MDAQSIIIPLLAEFAHCFEHGPNPLAATCHEISVGDFTVFCRKMIDDVKSGEPMQAKAGLDLIDDGIDDNPELYEYDANVDGDPVSVCAGDCDDETLCSHLERVQERRDRLAEFTLDLLVEQIHETA